MHPLEYNKRGYLNWNSYSMGNTLNCTLSLTLLKFQVKNDGHYKRSNSPMAVFQFGHLVSFEAFGQFGFRVKWKGALAPSFSELFIFIPTKRGKLKLSLLSDLFLRLYTSFVL